MEGGRGRRLDSGKKHTPHLFHSSIPRDICTACSVPSLGRGISCCKSGGGRPDRRSPLPRQRPRQYEGTMQSGKRALRLQYSILPPLGTCSRPRLSSPCPGRGPVALIQRPQRGVPPLPTILPISSLCTPPPHFCLPYLRPPVQPPLQPSRFHMTLLRPCPPAWRPVPRSISWSRHSSLFPRPLLSCPVSPRGTSWSLGAFEGTWAAPPARYRPPTANGSMCRFPATTP